jgi:hypothetical protein
MTPRFKNALAASLVLLAVSGEGFVFAVYVVPREAAARELGQMAEIPECRNWRRQVV